MQLYFIRHAQSQNNALWAETQSDDGRSADPDLTELGHQQAQTIASFLSQKRGYHVDDWDNSGGFDFTHIYTSLMLRAVRTGTYIADTFALPLLSWPDIHEYGGLYLDGDNGDKFGQTGPNRAFFETHFPRLVLPDTLNHEGWWNRPYEPREAMFPRASQFLRELYARHGQTEDRVALVSHGGFCQAFLTALFGLSQPGKTLGEEARWLWFRINNTSVTRIDLTADAIQVMYLNRVDFFRPEQIT